MPYTKEQRRLLRTKQEKIQVRTGVPLVSDLSEGVPVLRSTDSGVYQYVRHNSTLYKVKLDRASDASGVEKSSLSANGYMTFSNGIIMQWGTETNSGTTAITVTFPIPFPNSIFTAVCSTNRTSSGNSGFNHCNFNDTDSPITTMQIVVDAADGHWLAIGN